MSLSVHPYSAFFEETERGLILAERYAGLSQDSLGLNWLNRYSERVSLLVAYYSVMTDPATAALLLNQVVYNMVRATDPLYRFSDKDEEIVTVETIRALYHTCAIDVSATDSLVDVLLGNIANEEYPSSDAAHLKDVLTIF